MGTQEEKITNLFYKKNPTCVTSTVQAPAAAAITKFAFVPIDFDSVLSR